MKSAFGIDHGIVSKGVHEGYAWYDHPHSTYQHPKHGRVNVHHVGYLDDKTGVYEHVRDRDKKTLKHTTGAQIKGATWHTITDRKELKPEREVLR